LTGKLLPLPFGDRELAATLELSGEVRAALASDQTIDIVTRGARTGRWRTTEIWFTRIDERIVICGTPGAGGDGGAEYHPRDWLANLRRHPRFWFCFKESMQYCIPATASPVTARSDRRYIMSHDATAWYRAHGPSVDELVSLSPIIEVRFCAGFPDA
jgi:hypothetical protein